jgi:hypothetical protein
MASMITSLASMAAWFHSLESISTRQIEGAERGTALPRLESRDSSSTMRAVLSPPSPPTVASFYC